MLTRWPQPLYKHAYRPNSHFINPFLGYLGRKHSLLTVDIQWKGSCRDLVGNRIQSHLKWNGFSLDFSKMLKWFYHVLWLELNWSHMIYETPRKTNNLWFHNSGLLTGDWWSYSLVVQCNLYLQQMDYNTFGEKAL